MSLGSWSKYFNRSSRVLAEGTSKILTMSGANMPSTAPLPLLKFHSPGDLEEIATGCDADIGGTSSVHFDLDESKAGRGTGRFWGDMRLGVKKGLEGRVRGGYAAFRNKYRPTLFGEILWDVTFHRYLALRVRALGDVRTRNSYYVNIQTEGPITTDVWQHRLYFNRDDGKWEDVFIPFDDFVLTNAGQVVTSQAEPEYTPTPTPPSQSQPQSQSQPSPSPSPSPSPHHPSPRPTLTPRAHPSPPLTRAPPYHPTLLKDRVRTVGISILGGTSGVDGRYELGVDSVWAEGMGGVGEGEGGEREREGGEKGKREGSEGTRWARGAV